MKADGRKGSTWLPLGYSQWCPVLTGGREHICIPPGCTGWSGAAPFLLSTHQGSDRLQSYLQSYSSPAFLLTASFSVNRGVG